MEQDQKVGEGAPVSITPEAIDKMDSVSYPLIAQGAKNEIDAEIVQDTAQADKDTKDIINTSRDGLVREIDNTRKTEEAYVPRPATWKRFVEIEMERFHEAGQDLRNLVGDKARNAKDNIVNKADKVFAATMKLTETMDSMRDYLREQQKVIQKDPQEMQQCLAGIIETAEQMKKQLCENDSPSVRENMNKMSGNLQKMSKEFAYMYQESQRKKRGLVPALASTALESAKDALKKINTHFSGLLKVTKTAVTNKSRSLAERVAAEASKTAGKGADYATTLHKGFTNAVNNGKSMASTLKHLHVGVMVVDDRKLDAQAIKDFARGYMEGKAKKGLSEAEMKKAAKAGKETFDKACAAEMNRPQTKEIVAANTPVPARA